MSRIIVLALSIVVVALVACSGGQAPSASPTVSPDATTGPLSPVPGTQTVAGVALFPPEAWSDQGGSNCAVTGDELPFFNSIIFSIPEDDLPDFEPPDFELRDTRVCKDRITAVGYVSDGPFLILANGPHQWPTNASPDRISEGMVDGRPAVLIEPTDPDALDALVIVAEEFGLTIVSRIADVETGMRFAEAVNREDVLIPQGKESFQGTLNDVRLYNYLRGEDRQEGCEWGPRGVQDVRTRRIQVPDSSRLDVLETDVPEGFELTGKIAISCGGDVDQDLDFLEVFLLPESIDEPELDDNVIITRLTGEPAWHSLYSEDWLTEGEIDGRPAVFISQPPLALDADNPSPVQVVVNEKFGLTVVVGFITLDEAKLIAEGLSR